MANVDADKNVERCSLKSEIGVPSTDLVVLIESCNTQRRMAMLAIHHFFPQTLIKVAKTGTTK